MKMNDKIRKCVIPYSGGQDSSVILYSVYNSGEYDEIYCLWKKCYCGTPEHKSKMKKTLEDLLKNIRTAGMCSMLNSFTMDKKLHLHTTVCTLSLKMNFWK